MSCQLPAQLPGKYADYLVTCLHCSLRPTGRALRTSASPLAWLAVAGILALFTRALTWIAVIAGLSAKSVDGASGFSYPLIFLPFISSAFVPTDTMPGPVRAFAENQPVTAIVNTIQDLFAQRQVGSDIWIALAWCLGTLVLAYVLAVAAYRRKIT
jgi:ABC-2 type transport system permease protein